MSGESRRHGKVGSGGGGIGLGCEGWLGVCWAGKGILDRETKAQRSKRSGSVQRLSGSSAAEEASGQGEIKQASHDYHQPAG